MTEIFALPTAMLLIVGAWMAVGQFLNHKRVRQQQKIVQCGASCVGQVVAIQRPSVVDTCTRLYFDFEPPGLDRPLRVCHIDRGTAGQLPTALPYVGQRVSVRYLREQPQQALIVGLS